MSDIRERLSGYLRERARWRSPGELEIPDDERNSPALEAAAREVDALPADDPRLAQLDVLQEKQRLKVLMLLSDESGQLVERYGLAGPDDVTTVDELLDRLIECEVAASLYYDNPLGDGPR